MFESGRDSSFGEFYQIAIVDFFFDISYVQKAAVQFVERFLIKDKTQQLQSVLQRMSTATGGEQDIGFVDAYILWVHDFVRTGVFQKAVLMDSRRVRKSITTHDGFIGLNGHTHHFRY